MITAKALRVIVRTDDAGMASHVGGAVNTTFETFIVEDEELIAHLEQYPTNSFFQRQIIGWELMELK